MMLLRVGVALVALSWPFAAYADKGDDDDDGAGTHVDAKAGQRGGDAKPAGTVVQATTVNKRGRGEVPRELKCDNWPWPYKLVDDRTDIEPARLASQNAVQRNLILVTQALAECQTPPAGDKQAPIVCVALQGVLQKYDESAAIAFDTRFQKCLESPARPNDGCEGVRAQLITLRRYEELATSRAELVLAEQICAQPVGNGGLKVACDGLHAQIAAEAGDQGNPGSLWLDMPLPENVEGALNAIRQATEGRFQTFVDNSVGARATICHRDPSAPPRCGAPAAPLTKAFLTTLPNELVRESQRATWGMCNELELADCRANTCRAADIYIDERGEIHLNKPLTTRAQRKNATLCVDVSDFDSEHPLMITVGMRSTQSVPERVWPGETIAIGSLIDRPVTSEDVLSIAVYGKARGASLAEVLEKNGIHPDADQNQYVGSDHDEACRIAAQYVPVVEHELPVGAPATQAVIPVLYGRGRDGATKAVNDGDAIFVWVRDIEPGGAVAVQQANGAFVSYQPPPLLGDSNAKAPTQQVGNEIASAEAGVNEPSVPRRARYAGSRVLRLGHPAGNNEYEIKICAGPAHDLATEGRRTCQPVHTIVDEKLYVHGKYHLGLRAHFGYSWFDQGELVADRTPRAQAMGPDVYEVKQRHLGDEDFALLLALYPWGRDPYRFDYNMGPHGHYWENVALLGGFTLRKAEVWENLYLGGSLPIANGVSLTVLANLALRERPLGVREGDLLSYGSGVTPNLAHDFGSERQLDVGISVGVSLDYDLAERAFKAVWQRLTSTTPAMTAAAPATTEGQ